MEKIVFLSESCIPNLFISCLETPHKEVGGFLIGREEKRFVNGAKNNCLTIITAHPLLTSESTKNEWVPGNLAAYNRVLDTLTALEVELVGEYHSHINGMAKLSKADKKYIKEDFSDIIKKGIKPTNWIELVFNIQERNSKKTRIKKMSTTYSDKKIKCKIAGIANKNKIYNITIAAYTYYPKSKRFLECEVIIP